MAQGAGKHQPAPTVTNTKECAIPAPIERKSYRANWKAGDALNARRRNSSANRAGQQSAAIDRCQKTAQWGLIAAIAARFVKIRHHGPLGAATKRPEENLGASKARLNSSDLAF